jgi:cytochrome P450
MRVPQHKNRLGWENFMNTREPLNIPSHVPVDLVQDFSFHNARGIDRDPAAVVDALRDDRDIVYGIGARRGRDCWVFKSYDLIIEALQNPTLFSSERFSGISQLLDEDWLLIPVEVDPPLHKSYRQILSKLFAPSRMKELEEGIANSARALTDAVLPERKCDFQKSIATPLPTSVFLDLLGLPLEDATLFLEWEAALLHGIDLKDRAVGARGIRDYLVDAIKSRELHPRDDILSYIARVELEGRSLDPSEKLGMCFNLYVAGLDTVVAALGYTFKHLAENPERQAKLRIDKESRAAAIEEMLRTNSMVIAGRFVTQDTDFHGVQLKRGDYVSLPTMFANRDKAHFTAPTDVDFGRDNVMSHVAFGTGIHNCLGSHLARRELKIVMDEWLDRVPEFRIPDGEAAVTYASAVFGVERLPLVW